MLVLTACAWACTGVQGGRFRRMAGAAAPSTDVGPSSYPRHVTCPTPLVLCYNATVCAEAC